MFFLEISIGFYMTDGKVNDIQIIQAHNKDFLVHALFKIPYLFYLYVGHLDEQLSNYHSLKPVNLGT